MAGSARADGGDVVSAEEYAAIFAALPTAYLVMSPDLTIVEANPAYLALLGRTRDDLIGRYVFDAFPPAPETLDDTGANPLQLSFERARDTGMPDLMPLFRYQVADQVTGRPVLRAWSLISAPVPGADGRTRLVLQRVEDVSEYLAERERLAESRNHRVDRRGRRRDRAPGRRGLDRPPDDDAVPGRGCAAAVRNHRPGQPAARRLGGSHR